MELNKNQPDNMTKSQTQSKATYPGGITEAQIKQWKARWGEVHQVEVPVDDTGREKLTGYFKKPSLEIISASARFAESDPIKSGTVLFENCWLGGDEALKTNDEARVSCMKVLGKLFRVREATIKKL